MSYTLQSTLCIIHDIIDLVKNDNPKMLKQFIDSFCIFKNKCQVSLIFFVNYLVLDKTFMHFLHDFTMKISNKGKNRISFQGTLLHRSGPCFIIKFCPGQNLIISVKFCPSDIISFGTLLNPIMTHILCCFYFLQILQKLLKLKLKVVLLFYTFDLLKIIHLIID